MSELSGVVGTRELRRRARVIPMILAALTLAILPVVHPYFVRSTDAAFPGCNGGIAFASDRNGDYQIYSMNPDGSDVTQLTYKGGYMPSWSADGSKIAFAATTDPSAGWTSIFIMNADGSGQVQITDGPYQDLYPTWSPDGSEVAFSRASADPDYTNGLYVVSASGDGVSLLVPGGSTPAWSPDGLKIAFSLAPQFHIYTLSPNGTGLTPLTSDDHYTDFEPAWSPDGLKIAFTRIPVGGGAVTVNTMNADGSNLTNRTPPLAGANSHPAWSPDGLKIAFTKWPPSGKGFGDIFVLRVNGSGDATENLTNDPADDDHPSWQPAPPSKSNGKCSR